MKPPGSRRVLSLLPALLLTVVAADRPVRAQQAQLSEGFQVTLDATATIKEMNAQNNLWVMEVTLKPMRMRWVELTDPQTGTKKKELVWYLVYKVVNRPLEARDQTVDLTPVNDDDPLPTPLFVPEFTLVTNDEGGPEIYPDVVLAEAQADIVQREKRPLKNAIQIVGPVPPLTPKEAKEENAIYGVAMWRGVDPDTDFFTVYLTGFSNGYRTITGPDGKPLTARKTIMVEYWRPGDRFDPIETEFRLRGEPKWLYRPDEAKDVPAPAAQPPSPPPSKGNAP